MSRSARTVAVVLAVTVAGCTVVTALTDLDSEASSSRDADGSPDAGTGIDAANDGTSVADADVEDAPVTTDGGLCAGDAHDLCDDFDEGALGAPPRWTDLEPGVRGARLALADDVVFSPARALSATIAIDAGSNPVAALSRDLTGPATGLDCRFQLRAESLDGTGLVHAMTIGVTPPPATGFAPASLELRIVPAALDLRVRTPLTDGGTAFAIQRNLGPPLVGQWLPTRFRLSGLGASPRLEVWLGESPALDEAVTLPPVGRFTFELGVVGGIAGTTTWRMLFDDVVCDVAR